MFRKMSNQLSNSMKKVSANRLDSITQSCSWNELTQMAQDYDSVNLGRGYPDFAPPEFLCKALSEAVVSDSNSLLNHYTRPLGHPRLVKALSALYQKLTNHVIDPFKQILVTAGAFEALSCAMAALVDPGDEVILIEPFFPFYQQMVRIVGGVPVFIALRPPNEVAPTYSSADWTLDMKALESKFSTKTKLILLNTPNNPLGKMFTHSELTQIAELCQKYDTIAIMDEVYEWLVYEGQEHIRMATLEGMWDRTLTIGSAGKAFSVTGWKTGWVYGPERLVQYLQTVHVNLISCCNTPVQESIAVGLEQEIQKLDTKDSYWHSLVSTLTDKLNRMTNLFTSISMSPIVPQGGYFLIVDISKLVDKIDLSHETGSKNMRFVKWLCKHRQLQVMRMDVFYSEQNRESEMAQNLVRICFIKSNETLERAEVIVRQLGEEFGK